MDPEAVKTSINESTEKLKSATSKLSLDAPENNVLVSFVKGCEQVAQEFTNLAETYEKDMEEWVKLTQFLLECLEKSVSSDNASFDELNKAIDEVKLDINVEDQHKAVMTALSKSEELKALIETYAERKKQLQAEADNKCANRTVAAPQQQVEMTVDDAQSTTSSQSGGRRKRYLRRKGKKSLKKRN